MYLYNYWRIMANDLLSYPLNMNSSESRGNGDHRVTFVALKPRFNSGETAPREWWLFTFHQMP